MTIRGFRWWIAGLLLLGTGLSFFDRQVLSVLAPTVTAELGMDNVEYGKVVAAFVLSYTVMFALGGRFLDLVGTRLGMLLCVSVWTVASAAHALVRTPGQLGGVPFPAGRRRRRLFSRRDQGGLGVVSAAATLAGDRLRDRRCGDRRGVRSAAGDVDGGDTWAGVASRFCATGALGAVVGLAVGDFLPAAAPQSPFVSAAELAGSKRTGRWPGTRWRKTTPLVPLAGTCSARRDVWGLLMTRFLLDPVIYLYMFWIPQYLSQERSATLADIGRLAWIPFLTLDVANMLGGLVSDRLVRGGLVAAWPREDGDGRWRRPSRRSPSCRCSLERMDVAVLLDGRADVRSRVLDHELHHADRRPGAARARSARSLGLCGCAGGVSGFLTTDWWAWSSSGFRSSPCSSPPA